MKIFPADTVEAGSTISTTSSSFHKLTLKFPDVISRRIVTYKVEQNIIHSLNNKPQIRSGIKELAQVYCAFGSTILDANAQDTKQQQTKT